MSVIRVEIPNVRDIDSPLRENPRRIKLFTVLGWFAILGLVAAVIGATLVFTA